MAGDGPDLSRLHLSAEERERAPRVVPGWLKALGAVGLVALGLGGGRLLFGAGPAREEVRPVRVPDAPSALPTESALPVASANVVQAGGRVESSGRRELSVSVGGVVAAVHVERGAEVQAGALLLELESEAQRAEVAQMQAAYEAAQARYLELKEGARPAEVEEARQEGQAAEARAQDAEEKAAQAERLVKAGAVTPAQLTEAQHTAQAERAKAKAAGAKLRLLEEGTRRTALVTALAEANRAKAGLAQAQAQLELRRLRAPSEGTVVEVRAKPGEAVSLGGPAPVLLTDLKRLEVKVDVPEAKAALVRAGDRATIVVEALGSATFKGQVLDVGLEADRQKGTLEVTVAFDADQRLEAVRPRMAARAAIDVRR